MRPDCYGQYSVHPKAPCCGCALQGPCAHLVSDMEGFSILSRPRFTKPNTTYAVSTAARYYPDIANEIHRNLMSYGLDRGGGAHDCWYWLKVKPRIRFGHLMEARPGQVVFYVDCIRIKVAKMLPVVRCSPVSVFYNRPEYPGILVVSSIPGPLCRVVTGIADHVLTLVGSKHDLS